MTPKRWVAYKLRNQIVRSPLFQQFLERGFWDANKVDLIWRCNGTDVREQADWLVDLWYLIRALEQGDNEATDNPVDVRGTESSGDAPV